MDNVKLQAMITARDALTPFIREDERLNGVWETLDELIDVEGDGEPG